MQRSLYKKKNPGKVSNNNGLNIHENTGVYQKYCLRLPNEKHSCRFFQYLIRYMRHGGVLIVTQSGEQVRITDESTTFTYVIIPVGKVRILFLSP